VGSILRLWAGDFGTGRWSEGDMAMGMEVVEGVGSGDFCFLPLLPNTPFKMFNLNPFFRTLTVEMLPPLLAVAAEPLGPGVAFVTSMTCCSI